MRDYEGNIVFFAECYSTKQTPSDRAEDMVLFFEKWGFKRLNIVYDTNMEHNLQYYTGADKSPIQIFREVFRQRMGKDAPIMRMVSKKSEDDRKYRIVCNEAFKEYLNWHKNEKGEFILRPRLYATTSCENFIRTVPELVHDPDSMAGLDFDPDIGEDHPYDAAKMCVMELRTPVKAVGKTAFKNMDELMNVEFEKIIEKFENRREKVDWTNI
jgi:hypothetical protein